MLHLRRFLVAAVVFACAYGVYAQGVAPWIDSPDAIKKKESTSPTKFPLAQSMKRDFSGLFPPGSWELGNPKVVETAQCTLLLQDYKPTEDGSMELKPCTLIFYMADPKHPAGEPLPDGPDTRRPVVMQAPEGAILQFDRALDLAKAEFGRVVGGKLVGPILIFSPPSKPGADDALRISTRNVQMDPERVWTPHDVEFQYGSSFGRGRDLTIALLPTDKPSAGKTKSPAIGGVRAMQLNRIERLHLEAGGTGLVPTPESLSFQASQQAKKPGGKEPPLEIRCQGPFVLDMQQQIAAFDDRVEVSRVHAVGPPDRLLCQTLTLHFKGPAEVKASAKQAGDKLAEATDGGKTPPQISSQVERIVAAGTPVVLEGASQGVFATAARMEYNVATRRIALEPAPLIKGDWAQQVSLTQWQNKFEARELEYELADQGRIGRLWAAGPGRLQVVQGEQEKQQTIVATWNKELRIRPHEQHQVISLSDAASISVEPLGRFSADELHLWVLEITQDATHANDLERLPSLDSSPADGPNSSQSPAAPQPPQKFTLVPDRMLAQGHVLLDSPQLHAETGRLEAWFVNQPIEAEPPGAKPAHNMPMPAGPTPLPDDPQRLPAANDLPPPSQQKFDVVGQLIQLQIARDGRRHTIDGLNIRGGATIKEIHTEKPGQLPLIVRGEAVELRHGASRNAQIDVVGQPASVAARGLNLSGNAIHLHRGENRLWIDGAGTATLPMPPPKPSLEPPPPPQSVRVTWQGHMTFDGLTAHLESEVVARGPTQYALADTLDVTLSDRLDFSNPSVRASAEKPIGKPIEMARLAFTGDPGHPVHLENIGVDNLGQQTSLDKVEVANLIIDRLAGSLRADGAGWVSTVRQGDGGLGLAAAPDAGPALPFGAAPSATPPSATPAKLTYLHVSFQGGIVGDLNKHEIQFQRDVTTLYGQVDHWSDTLSATRLDDLGKSGAYMTTDKLTVLEMLIPNNPQRWIELEARGNTLIEAQEFTARAQRVSYSTQKELLVVEGDGRSDAEFWKSQGPPGSPFGYTASQKFQYWRKTGDLHLGPTKVIDLQQLSPASAKPRPTRWR
jgi:hypothetical protein